MVEEEKIQEMSSELAYELLSGKHMPLALENSDMLSDIIANYLRKKLKER